MAAIDYRLDPLKTLHETRSSDEFVEAYVVEIPAKLASKALGIVKPIFPNDRTLSFAHLRRVCTLSHLPIDLTWRRDYNNQGLQTVFLLLPKTTVPWNKICETFASYIDEPGLPRCFNAPVPRYAPLSADQAELWTERFWPTTFNPASQLLQDAPPLHQLRRVQTELDTADAVRYLQVARDAAQETKTQGYGKATGAVVVNPKTGQVMAVAGDARWWTDESTVPMNPDLTCGAGRPEHHALMRVVAMVANKELRKRLRMGAHVRFASTCKETPAGQPLTDIETAYAEALGSPTSPYAATPTSPKDPMENLAVSLASSLSSLQSASSTSSTSSNRSEGYLCSGLDLYLTHEPCVCCAMAMIHSRFRSCVFEKRMPGSGALTARDHPGSLGYGLFWRRELNWRVMTFQYKEYKKRRGRGELVEAFHA